MSKKIYPEAIYETRDGLTMTLKQRNGSSGKARRHAYDLGYEHGKQAQTDLTDWSNLTEAIKGDELIDWEKLDGMPARCVHLRLGTLYYKLVRNPDYPECTSAGWWDRKDPESWELPFHDAWYGQNGWALYIKGDIPLRARTADQLETGTCFMGIHPETRDPIMGVVVSWELGSNTVLFDGPHTPQEANRVKVVMTYGIGTFQKQKDQA